MMANADSSKDWPTLSDSNACASTSRNKQRDNSKDKPKTGEFTSASAEITEKETSEVNPDVTDGATGLDNGGTSTESNKTGARRKKHNGKTKWKDVTSSLLTYKDSRHERHYNDSHRFGANSRRFNNHESTNVNGHEHSRGRGFRGGRGGRNNAFRSRRESAVNSDTRRYQRVPQEAACAPQIAAENVDGSVDVKEAVKEQLMRQIEYYFSDKNLVKDPYLRLHMDDQGYAQLSLIATFPRIKRLTNDLQLILEAVRKSSHLEVSDDVKVRPVVDPLRWPIKDLPDKEILGGAASANIREPFVDIISSQFYNMSLDPTLYQHLPGLKSHLPNELSWQFIPVDDQDKNGNVFCIVNGIYPQVGSDGLSVSTNNSNIPNGHTGSPEQLNSPNSDLADEIVSQCGEPMHQYHQTNDFEKVSSFSPECFLSEIPSYVDSNGVSSIADNLNIPNGHSSSDSVSDIQCDLNSELASQYKLNDCQSKTNAPFYPVTGIHPHADSNNSASVENSTISNGLACSSDLRPVDEINAYNCYYGQISNGVIMYNSGGHYYVEPSNEILADSTDSSKDKSTVHNKSPEPSR